MSDNTRDLAIVSRDLAVAGEPEPLAIPSEQRPIVQALRRAGTEPWLDTGDRQAAAADWGPELGALTTNNTLINQVIQTGALDEALSQAAGKLKAVAPGASEQELVTELGFIANARVSLDLVRTFGTRVSVELHPAFAEDSSAAVAWAQRYFALCPESFIIKVPLTPAGFVAVRHIAGLGIPVNYTLGFSARQNVLAALFSRPAFVNVFLGRLNAVVKDNKLGDGANVGERACLASDAWVKRFRSEDGGPPTRQIAASMRGPDQVVTLAGVDVHTIPPKVFRGFVELGTAGTVAPYSAVDLPVQADLDLGALWDVPDAFVDFAGRAHAEAGSIASGADLIRLAGESGFGDLFHAWTADERAEIRADGKIPILDKWVGRVAIDDLMTRAALESFCVDQAALDDRLRGLL